MKENVETFEEVVKVSSKQQQQQQQHNPVHLVSP
jgi:hypothetical protein